MSCARFSTVRVIPMTHSAAEMERRALVELHHLHGGDSVQLWRWLKRYGSARAALKHYPRQTELPGVGQEGRRPSDPFAVLARLGARVLTWNDPGFPPLLARYDDPPAVLYVQGELKPEDACAVAIVGSRRATRWARRLAFEMARDLAAAGVTVVSGLAEGVDAAAHEGALEAGRTIAVMGSGIDRTYPPHHAQLRARIARGGAVVTQFPCGAPPKAFHFPLRNDTIVRLCLGVVVVEAPEHSGAILTAHCALERNVELMVCPGDAGRPSCRGSNRLLKMKGTAAVESAQDVLEALRLEVPLLAATAAAAGGPVPDWLTAEPASVEELALRSGESVAAVRARLTELELEGRVVRLEGDRYRLVR